MHHDGVGGCFHKRIDVHTGGPWLEPSQVDDVKGFHQYNKQHHAAETLPVLKDVSGTPKLSSNLKKLQPQQPRLSRQLPTSVQMKFIINE